MRTAYRVYYTEFERGWGSRPDGYKDFEGDDAHAQATKHCEDFNAKNTETVAPDWYMIAETPVMVDLDLEEKNKKSS